MRQTSLKTSLMVFLLSVALFGWAQDAPPAGPPPDNQPATGGERQPGMGRRFQGIGGTITAISGNTLTVKTMDGNTAQVNVSDKTRYRKDRQAAQLSDFKVGDQIMVRGESAGENAWNAEVVAARPAGGPGGDFREAMGKRFIVGEIKSISGTQLTIQRPDGVSQTITVDESTSFKKQGESITLADLKPGDHVFGRGELKNDVFVPAELNVGDPRMMRRGGGPGQGQGAPPDSH